MKLLDTVLQEGNWTDRSKDITREELIQLLYRNSFARKILADMRLREEPYPMFRGISVRSSYLFLDPTKTIRDETKGGLPYYSGLMRLSPKFRGYPDRRRSVIFGTSQRIARGYGTVYMGIPLKDKPVAITDNGWADIWGIFGHLGTFKTMFGISLMSLFNVLVPVANDVLGIQANGFEARKAEYLKTVSDVLESSDESTKQRFVDEMMNDHVIANSLFGVYLENSFPNIRLWKHIIAFMDPKTLGMSLTNFKTLNKFSEQQREAWSESPCVLIKWKITDWMEMAELIDEILEK